MPYNMLLSAMCMCLGAAEVMGFAPAPVGAPARGMKLRMQLSAPPPPQPVLAPAHPMAGSAQQLSSGTMSRFEERVGLDGILLAHGGEHSGGLDVPYKLKKIKDNEMLHMSEEKKAEWEFKLTGEEVNQVEKRNDKILGVVKLSFLWSPMILFANFLRNERWSDDRTEAVYNLVFLLCVPINIVFSGMAYPDAEWEKVHEVLTWMVIWSPAVAIWALIKVIDSLRQESTGKELAERR